jgi:hypothetical protein
MGLQSRDYMKERNNKSEISQPKCKEKNEGRLILEIMLGVSAGIVLAGIISSFGGILLTVAAIKGAGEVLTQTVQIKPMQNAVLKSKEARNTQLLPSESPGEWDFIASKEQKCWFHKKTRRKVCEDY